MGEKTITIKKGDLLYVFNEVARKDEATKKLFEGMPLLSVTITIIIKKIENVLFNEEDNE